MAKQNLDPKNVNGRLYNQIHRLLEAVEQADKNPAGEEGISIRERIAMIIAVARIQTVFVALRKEKQDDNAIAGSKVRKYQTTFKAHDAGRRAKNAGSTAAPAADLSVDGLDDEDDDDIFN